MRGSRSSMENADFRRLVAEGRAAQEQRAAAEERPPAPGTLHPDDEDEDALPAVVGGVPDVSFGGGEGAGAKRKGKKKVRKGKPGGGDHDAAAGAHLYRDRAKERRKAEALPEVDPAAGNAVVIPGITNADLSGITLEQSKFLGGDIEHTHLVKGLDFALLQKVRGGKEEAAAGAAQGMKGAPTGAEFRSDLARAVHRIAVQQPTASPPADKLQPGRTAFVYDLADGLGSLPITVLNPRDGRPDPDLVDARRDKEVLGRISKVMSYLKVGTSGATVKRLRRKKKALDSLQELQAVKAAAARAAAEADVDIFADEGGAPGADPQGPNMLLVKSRGASYFGTSREVGDGDTRTDFSLYAELKAGPASGGTAGGAGEDAAEALFTDYLKETVERGGMEERTDAMFGLRLEDDESVYPGGMASYDMNDDDVGRKVEGGGRGKEGGLSRAQKEKRSEAKLDNQLTKIQEQLEKEGKSHEGAFAAAEPTPKPGKQKKAPSGGQAAGGRQKRLKV